MDSVDLDQTMEKQQTNSSVFHSLNANTSGLFTSKVLVTFVVIVVVGLVGGYFLAQKVGPGVSGVSQTGGPSSASGVKQGAVYGSNDTATFKDNATGVLQPGGVEGEGQYHLVRPGGDSQNVYLTSSLVDLSLFVGKKIKVNGQTQKAQVAGWLMDVGRVEVL